MENREECRVPLLGPRPAAADAGGREEGAAGLGRRLLEENRKLWKVAGPAICTRFSGFGVTVISMAFMGHIGATELAAFAIVSTVLMRFGNGILVTTT
jgi:MATE family multidrug resistance protein